MFLRHFYFGVSILILLIEENCIGGCPCSSFDCISTTTTQAPTTTAPSTPSTQKAVLVLSTESNKNKPMVIDFNGKSGKP